MFTSWVSFDNENVHVVLMFQCPKIRTKILPIAPLYVRLVQVEKKSKLRVPRSSKFCVNKCVFGGGSECRCSGEVDTDTSF